MKQVQEKAADAQISVTDRPKMSLLKIYEGLGIYFARGQIDGQEADGKVSLQGNVN